MHEAAGPMWVGYIPFTILVGSLCLAILASILIRPFQLRPTLVFVGTIFFLFSALLVGTWGGGLLFSLIIPE